MLSSQYLFPKILEKWGLQWYKHQYSYSENIVSFFCSKSGEKSEVKWHEVNRILVLPLLFIVKIGT